MKLWQVGLVLTCALNVLACGSGSEQDSSSMQGIRDSFSGMTLAPRVTFPIDDLRPNPILVQVLRNQNVLEYAQSRIGQRIDRGECWDLVNQALNYAGARAPYGYENYEFGKEISRGELAPGNIISFREVRIQYPNGAWMSFSPKHVAIVKQVSGSRVTVLHQNAPWGSAVHEDVIDLNYVTSGTVRYFAAQHR